MRDRTFERNVHRLKHNSLTRKQSIEGTRTVRCAAISRIARTARSHRAQNYCEQNSLLMLSAAGRHCHHRLQDGERSKCLRSLLSSVASAASFPTYASSASPLRLSGEPPDSRRGGAVTFNPSRRAGCEGARQSRGSHAATWVTLERAVGMDACGQYALLEFGIFAQSVLTRWRMPRLENNDSRPNLLRWLRKNYSPPTEIEPVCIPAASTNKFTRMVSCRTVQGLYRSCLWMEN